MSKVFISGTFNILHAGHIRLFQFAKKLGDKLIVAVESDKFSLGKSFINEKDRFESVKSNIYVDECFILNDNLEKYLLDIKPNIVLKGSEHENSDNIEKKIIQKFGGKILFASGDNLYNSNQINELYNKKIRLNLVYPKTYLKRHKISKDKIISTLKKIKKLNVAVVGDIIIDNYIDCQPIGMSREEPVVVLKEQKSKKYLGGSGIVASHAAVAGAKAYIFSVLGNDQNSKFALSKLEESKIKQNIFYDISRNTTLKKRFQINSKTSFKTSILNEHFISNEIQNKIYSSIQKIIKQIDVLIFSDFNYGCLPPQLIKKITNICIKNNVYVAADCQSSSQIGNISIYKNLNLIAPTEYEARIALNNNNDGLVVLSEKLRKKTNSKNVLLKIGSDGLIINDNSSNKIKILTDKIESLNKFPVDVTGAGDSLLIYSTLSHCITKNIWLSSYIGSLAASLQISRIGNQPLKLEELIDNL